MKPRKEVRINNHRGIFRILVLDSRSNKYKEPLHGCRYRAVKSIKGNRKTKSFRTLREAVDWKNTTTFLPRPTNHIELTPVVKSKTFGEVFKKYQESTYPNYEKATLEYKEEKALFFTDLSSIAINNINPDLLDSFIRSKKELAITQKTKRCSFKHELRELKTFFNWYRENEDYTFSNPVLKRHNALGFIRKPNVKEKKMKPDELKLFFQSLKDNCPELYYDIAIIQFFTAGRIGEIAGLQKGNIDLENSSLKIQHTVVWNKRKDFVCLKTKPKNGKVRFCTIAEPMIESLARQLEASSTTTGYVFQIKGEPVPYRQIQHNYSVALRGCGLGNKYSGTHFLRHSMAYITRLSTGSLDMTQAVTGHSDLKMVEHYAGSPDSKQKEAVQTVVDFLNVA